MIITVTGHRPEGCEDEEVVRRKIRNALDPDRISVLINGLAAGVDLWAADEAIGLGLEVWSARPWAGHGPRKGDEELYARVIENSSKVVNVVEQDAYPGPWVYYKRNEWMVDHATHILTYHNGSQKGGTAACLRYARKQERPVKNVY